MAAESVIADALIAHEAVGFGRCNCGWTVQTKLGKSWREDHERHRAAVIVGLHGIAIVDASPGTCPDDPVGTHRWVPTHLGWRCADCHRRIRNHPEAPATAASSQR